MKILAIERDQPGISDDVFQPHLKAEAARAWQLYNEGVIRELYFDRTRNIAVLMLECSDLDAARAALATLPLVEAGLISFDLYPLSAYTGFARLFTSERSGND